MNTTLLLKEVNDKYYMKIKKYYEKYIKNFDSIPNITKNVFIVPSNECIGKHSDLSNNRGKCESDTGYIYIRENAFNEHLLIHEFIHRLSRNRLRQHLFKRIWIEGIGYQQNNVDYRGLNELITEWLAFNITNYKENNNCQHYFCFINEFKKECDFDKIIEAYFNSDGQTIHQELCKIFPLNSDKMINNLTQKILLENEDD